MSKSRLLLTLAVLILGVSAGALLATQPASAQAAPGQEAGLSASVSPYELNPDGQGQLWVSDYRARRAWRINPATGVYTMYTGLPFVSDARMDAGGTVWWSDPMDNVLGRLSPDSGAVITWALPGSGFVWGLAFGVAGQVWATDSTAARAYAFTPGSGQLCTYSLPDGGISDYVTARGGAVWLTDWQNHRVVKLDPAANTATYWPLAAGAWPQGQATDAAGNLWWADEVLGELARLDETAGSLTEYPLPYGARPEMLAAGGGLLWYTDGVSGTLGALDPARASGITTAVVSTTVTVSPACVNLGPGTSSSAAVTTGALGWSAAGYAQVADGDGWEVYQLPAGAYPWGVAVQGGRVWAVDKGRGMLVELPVHIARVYVPAVLR